jgi:hypothetical protein
MLGGMPSSSSDSKNKAKLQKRGPKSHGGSMKIGLVL